MDWLGSSKVEQPNHLTLFTSEFSSVKIVFSDLIVYMYWLGSSKIEQQNNLPSESLLNTLLIKLHISSYLVYWLKPSRLFFSQPTLLLVILPFYCFISWTVLFYWLFTILHHLMVVLPTGMVHRNCVQHFHGVWDKFRLVKPDRIAWWSSENSFLWYPFQIVYLNFEVSLWNKDLSSCHSPKGNYHFRFKLPCYVEQRINSLSACILKFAIFTRNNFISF